MAQEIAQNQLIVKYGPYGSLCPQNFSFQIKECEHFKEVIIKHGNVVNGIGFVIAKPCGSTYTVSPGGICGQESRIALKCGEIITGISGTYGNYTCENQCVIGSIKINTNLCPQGYGPYGQGKGIDCPQNFASPCSNTDPVVGFFGRQTNHLESIGIFVKKEC